jgi:hypothetical protein
MKTETLRRVRNMMKLIKKGADIWETGNFRILWFDDPTPTPESKWMLVYHCRKRVFGHLRLIP